MSEQVKSRLVQEAVEAERWDELRELMDIEHKSESKEWIKGFMVGGLSVIAGISIVLGVERFIK